MVLAQIEVILPLVERVGVQNFLLVLVAWIGYRIISHQLESNRQTRSANAERVQDLRVENKDLNEQLRVVRGKLDICKEEKHQLASELQRQALYDSDDITEMVQRILDETQPLSLEEGSEKNTKEKKEDGE